MRQLLAPAILLATILAVQPVCAGATHQVQDLSFGGSTERVLWASPGQPKATLVLFPGGDGVIDLRTDGSIGARSNFLVRSRNHWLDLGYAFLLPDVPAGSTDLMGHRLTDDYAAAVATLVNFAKQQSPAPVWLVGTSQGTNAIVNAASRFTHGEIAGIVLTSSLTEPGKSSDLKETVFQADLAAIDVPALIVSHSDDACALSPPADDARLKAALSRSPKAEIVTVSGGKPSESEACEAKSPYGFYGVEAATIKQIADWIAQN